MPTATVTVAYINPPKPGKKMGSIKSQDGAYYGVWPDKLSMFEVGNTYSIVFTEENGFKNFKQMASDAQGNPTTRVMARAQAPHSGGDAKAEEMFVMGFLNRCYQGACGVPPQAELTDGIRTLRAAWKDGWEPMKAAISSEEVLNDEIPF
ncbi:MAG TPA: hypothetical protein VIY48_11470 [Candidatus Paceibacterota bacterium]